MRLLGNWALCRGVNVPRQLRLATMSKLDRLLRVRVVVAAPCALRTMWLQLLEETSQRFASLKPRGRVRTSLPTGK